MKEQHRIGKNGKGRRSSNKQKHGPTSQLRGLANSKRRIKHNAGAIKYGSLSRKQKEYLADYGELEPKNFEQDDEDFTDNSVDITTEIANRKRKLRKIVTEAELDKQDEINLLMPAKLQYKTDNASNEEEVEEWEKPSAYSQLVQLLKHSKSPKGSVSHENSDKYGDIMKINDDDMGYTAVLEEQEKILIKSHRGTQKRVKTNTNSQKAHEYDVANVANEPSISNDMEEIEKEIANDGSSDENDMSDGEGDDKNDNKGDEYETHFGDGTGAAMSTLIEQKQQITESYNDPLLGRLSLTTTNGVETQKEEMADDLKNISKFGIKQRIQKGWDQLNQEFIKGSKDVKDGSHGSFTPLQRGLLRHLTKYRDVLYCNRTYANANEIRKIYLLHALNHIYKNRDRVLKNNRKSAEAQKENKDIGEMKDQGFTRPKVLLLLPFRNTVVDVIQVLMTLSSTEQYEHKSRFMKEFAISEDEDGLDPSKPSEFNAIFSGNIDDHFRLGIKFTRKTMKLFADFYSADIIIASPLGLRTVIGAKGDKKRDFDFLSSVELVILDQAQMFLMQNWDHIEHIFQHLNIIPKDPHGCDFSRVKSWYLDGRAKYLRQTVIISDFLTPEINALYNKHFNNISGKIKVKDSYQGSIVDVIPQVQQTFTRFEAMKLTEVDDQRFKFFVEKILPTLRKSITTQSHTLIFIRSYFDFVRLRNYFEDNKYSFAQCCEYTSDGNISRARSNFFHGRANFILYTERCHFFRRYTIRGARHIVFYELPDHPQYYSEVVNFLSSKMEASAVEEVTYSVSTIFCKYDLLKLERVVGTERAQRMINIGKRVFILES